MVTASKKNQTESSQKESLKLNGMKKIILMSFLQIEDLETPLKPRLFT